MKAHNAIVITFTVTTMANGNKVLLSMSGMRAWKSTTKSSALYFSLANWNLWCLNRSLFLTLRLNCTPYPMTEHLFALFLTNCLFGITSWEESTSSSLLSSQILKSILRILLLKAKIYKGMWEEKFHRPSLCGGFQSKPESRWQCSVGRIHLN